MLKNTLLFICLFIFRNIELRAQSPLYDSLIAWHGQYGTPFLIIPAHYTKISQNLNFAETDKTDSFSLRLWASHMFGGELITISKEKESWRIHKYSSSSTSILTEVTFTSQISLQKFVSDLQKTDFKSLISQYEIQGFEDKVDDGTTYTLEVIVNKFYKVFQYHSPENNSDVKGYNKKFNDIISLIKQLVH